LAAYNPPQGGDDYWLLGHPVVNSGSTAAGGGMFNPGTPSIGLKPALVAGNQRVSASLGMALVAGERLITEKTDMAYAMQLGLSIPNRWGVWTGQIATVLSTPENSGMGNSFSGRFTFSRDITENFYFGSSLWAGGAGSPGSWALALDAGVFFRLGNWAFLKDMRLGLVAANMGKTFKGDYGVKGFRDKLGDYYYPSFITPRAGFAATVLSNRTVQMGFSTGLEIPSFQNFIWNIGLEAFIANIVTVSAGWKLNAVEIAEGAGARLPDISLLFTFSANTGKSAFMEKQGWDKSDFTVGGQYQSLGKRLSAWSAGATANFGMKDTDPPDIKLWEGSK
jgi:hypothetical protein